MNYLTKPLTEAEVRSMLDQDGWITFNIMVGLSELINLEDGLNEVADMYIPCPL